LADFESECQPTTVTRVGFAIDQQARPLVEAQARVLAGFELPAVAERHTEQPKRIEFVQRLIDQHGLSGLQQYLLVVGGPAQVRVQRRDHIGGGSTTAGTWSSRLFKIECMLV
jgi:hypothetical protein